MDKKKEVISTNNVAIIQECLCITNEAFGKLIGTVGHAIPAYKNGRAQFQVYHAKRLIERTNRLFDYNDIYDTSEERRAMLYRRFFPELPFELPDGMAKTLLLELKRMGFSLRLISDFTDTSDYFLSRIQKGHITTKNRKTLMMLQRMVNDNKWKSK